MADNHDMPALSVSRGLHDSIIAELRRKHPWMRIEAVHAAARAAAQSTTKIIQSTVAQQERQIQTSKARCSFMSLSAELRNRVYELVLLPQKPGDGGVPGKRGIAVLASGVRGPNGDWERTAFAQQPAIAQVSKSIRAETLPMYYGLNDFFASVIGISSFRKTQSPYHWANVGRNQLDARDLTRWLTRIGPANVRLLRHLVVCYGYEWRESEGNRVAFEQAWQRLMEPFALHPQLNVYHLEDASTYFLITKFGGGADGFVTDWWWRI